MWLHPVPAALVHNPWHKSGLGTEAGPPASSRLCLYGANLSFYQAASIHN